MWVRYDIAQIISKIHSWKMLRYLFMTSNSSTWIWKRVWQERWCWRVEQSLKNRFMCCISLKIWFLTRGCLCVVWKWIWEYEIAFRRAHPLARTRKPCARPGWCLNLWRVCNPCKMKSMVLEGQKITSEKRIKSKIKKVGTVKVPSSFEREFVMI